mgnify:CR=1 FL=1
MDKSDAKDLLSNIELLKDFYEDVATGGSGDSYNYKSLRENVLIYININNELKSRSSKLINKQTKNAFWQFIKNEYRSYAERRQYIEKEFEPIIEYLESIIYSKQEFINKIDIPFESNGELTQDFIIKQSKEIKKRIEEGNYEGAITSSKSFIEAIFSYIDKQINKPPKINPKDDLPKQYSQIKSCLNLDPSQKDLNDSLKQILQGLNSIVCGLSYLRNKMSDAHLPQYKPDKHHAVLAINCATTLAQFLFDTFDYQKQRQNF